ncbi:MAG TPA: hypothetical protein VFQ53_39620 [Kofleriaceae bacterium]|nr:hypothetical protein [Kofleriaceae bacterium]
MRCAALLVGMLVAASGVASAQPAPKPAPKPAPTKAKPQDPYAPAAPAAPQDPYAPAPPPTTPAPTPAPSPTAPSRDDPVLAEQVAMSLVLRAQELYDARVFVDAKQLAVEALVKSPKGPAADQARFLIKQINQQLGLADDTPKPDDKVDTSPIVGPTTPPPTQPERPDGRASRITSGVHGALYGGLLGATVGSFFVDDTPAKSAVPAGIATGVAGGLLVPRLVDKLDWNEAQTRTVGSGTTWGGMVGGLFADAVKTDGTTGRQVMVGASIGATVGGLGGIAIARKNNYTPGDIALVDTFAGIGAVGGLTMGMLMQPVETEAYSVNSIIGITGGVIVGMVAAPQTNTTPRRMARVAGMSALGAAIPFLLYAGIYDGNASGDERLVGALSSAGLVGGAWLGFRLTKDMDRGLDMLPGKRSTDDAPPSLVGRSSSGDWGLGTLTVQPLSQQLAPQHGMSIPLVGGAW